MMLDTWRLAAVLWALAYLFLKALPALALLAVEPGRG
jgi:hypothetical protein